MRILSANDIEKVVTPQEVMEAVKEALLLAEGSSYSMPKRLHTEFRGNTLLAMPCLTETAIGTKIVSVFPNNKDRELPVINGIMLLSDADTGQPKAIIDGSKLTAVRTGAVGGVGAELLNTDESPKLGVIGCGIQGIHQVISIEAVTNPKEVWLFDLDSKQANGARTFLEDNCHWLNIKIADTIDNLVLGCDIVVTATSAEAPIIPDDERLIRGKTFIAIGSYKPTMRELSDSVFAGSTRVFVDTMHAIDESGDMAIPIEKGLINPCDIHTLGKLLNGSVTRPNKDETAVFKSVGMALFDVYVANLIYKKAAADDIGVQVEL